MKAVKNKEIDKKVKREGQSFKELAWKKFKKNKLALFGSTIILILVFSAIFAPYIAPYDPYNSVTSNNMIQILSEPSSDYWLGTDNLGRDVLSRIIFAGRISLSVGLISVVIATTIGTLLGTIAGYFGGWVDSVIMRAVDVVISFPILFLIITVSTMLKPSIYNIIVIIGLVSWTRTARLVRGEILRVREYEFVKASQALGAKSGGIILRHILPNILAPIIVQATLQTARIILLEASLSFLGVGVQQPIPSWGNMLNAATSISILKSKPWVWVPPGIAILLTVLSINFIGDGLRDALDPNVMSID